MNPLQKRIKLLKMFILSLLLVSVMAYAEADSASQQAKENKDEMPQLDATPHQTHAQVMLNHERNKADAARAPNAVSEDIGDVAVIVDNGAIIIQPQPPKPIDLFPTNIIFEPTPDGFSVALAPLNLISPPPGSDIPAFGDDDILKEVLLDFDFPFLGRLYRSFFVNSNGNITFERGDVSFVATPAVMISGPPRIAPLFMDLSPQRHGSVHVEVRSDRAIVSWIDVPEFETENNFTFQVTLYSTGRIEFALVSGLSTTINFASVGVAQGNNEGQMNEIDYTSDLPSTFTAGSIFEEFHGEISFNQLDIVQLAREFYKTHADKYDFLIVFTDFPVNLRGTFASQESIRNQTTGIGADQIDLTSLYGSQGELETIVQMNHPGIWFRNGDNILDPPIYFAPSPKTELIFGPSGEKIWTRLLGPIGAGFGHSPMTSLGHEIEHRWLGEPVFFLDDRGLCSDESDPFLCHNYDLLGKALNHWSFFFNTKVDPSLFEGYSRSSPLEGNVIIDCTENSEECNKAIHDLFPLPAPQCPTDKALFLTAPRELVDGYSELDQYLMGLRTADEVGSFWYVENPTKAYSPFNDIMDVGRVRVGTEGIFFCGNRVDLDIENIQAHPQMGPRIPALGDEVDIDHRTGNPLPSVYANGNPFNPDVKTMAFILLLEQGPPSSPAHAAAIQQVDTFRRTWQEYANGPATGGRGKFDTSLDPDIY